jgi:hypothetical protein
MDARHTSRHRVRLLGVGRRLPVLLAAVAAALILAPTAYATPETDITSAGPLTDIGLGNELSCQVSHAGDTSFEFFPTNFPPNVTPGDCGTFFSTGGQLYAPDFRSHGGTATGSLGSYTPFTPVSQSGVTGSGTSSSPFQVTTTVGVGTTGLTITQVDSYVIGDENYRTDVTVSNPGTSAVSGRLYRAGDCFLQNSDVGYGFVDPTTNAPACTQNANNTPPGRIEEFVPITGGIHYVETFYDTLWTEIGAQTDLPNTCDCTTSEDNSAGINWDINVPAGGSVKFSSLTVFSPLGALALTTSKAADASTAAAGSSDGYSITISNPNVTPVTLTDIIDSLPTGFTYTAGSSTGATTSNPSISGQNLTWTGPFTVPGSGTVTLHFNVAVSSTPGPYLNNAGGDSAANTVTPTGPTAQITVTAVSPPTATIVTPPNGATYTQAQVVNASYSCTEGAGGPGLASCTGPVPNGSPIDTSTLGPHTFTVTATSKDGLTGTATTNYTVVRTTIEPPNVTIKEPRPNQKFKRKQTVHVNYSCKDTHNGPGIASCVGTVPNGGLLNTSTRGRHAFTVTATSKDGQSTTKTIYYRVT